MSCLHCIDPDCRQPAVAVCVCDMCRKASCERVFRACAYHRESYLTHNAHREASAVFKGQPGEQAWWMELPAAALGPMGPPGPMGPSGNTGPFNTQASARVADLARLLARVVAEARVAIAEQRPDALAVVLKDVEQFLERTGGEDG